MKFEKSFLQNNEPKEEQNVGRTKRRVGRTAVVLAGLAMAANAAEAQEPGSENDQDAISQEQLKKKEITVEKQSPQIGPDTITWEEAVENANQGEGQDIEGDSNLSIEESYNNISEIVKNPDNITGYLVLDQDGKLLYSLGEAQSVPYISLNTMDDIERIKKERPELADGNFLAKYESIVVDNYDDYIEEGVDNVNNIGGKEEPYKRLNTKKLLKSGQDFIKVDIIPSLDGGEVKIITEVHEEGVCITVSSDNDLNYLISCQFPEHNNTQIPLNTIKYRIKGAALDIALYIQEALYRHDLNETMNNFNSPSFMDGQLQFEAVNLKESNLGEERQGMINEAAQKYMTEISNTIEDVNQTRLEEKAAAEEKELDEKTGKIKGAFRR